MNSCLTLLNKWCSEVSHGMFTVEVRIVKSSQLGVYKVITVLGILFTIGRYVKTDM